MTKDLSTHSFETGTLYSETGTMTRTRICLLVVTLVLLAGSVSLYAQDPFGDPGDVGDLFSGTEATPAASDATQESEVERDPVVLSLRDADPRTAEDLTRAVEILVNLGRPDEAQKYLQTLVGANLGQASLAALHGRFGSTLFIRLMRNTPLQPAGAQFSKAVLDAAYQDARSPKRLQSLINQLNDPSPEVRYTAAVDLRAGGEDAVAALVGVLADPSRSTEHARIRDTLVRLGGISQDPLIAALESDDESLRLQAMVTLGQLESVAATPYLLRPFLAPQAGERMKRAARYALLKTVGQLPTLYDARLYLSRRAKDQLAAATDHETLVTVWRWDASRRLVMSDQVPSSDASLNTAHRIAHELHVLVPDDSDYRQLYLITMLESAKNAVGLDQPLVTGNRSAHATAAEAGADAIEEVLAAAMQQGHIAAAIGAAEVLGNIGDQRLLFRASGAPRPLAQALQHSNRRVRFTAAMSILQIDPQEPFPGSSYLPEALSYFLNTLGTRRALIAHPRLEKAQTLVGLLGELGFDADTSSTGAETIRLVNRSSDYEFILVSDAIDKPAVNELLQQLRRDPRTSELPIGLMARQGNVTQMERLTESDPLAETFPRPHDLVGVALATRRLLKRGERQRVPFERRILQAGSALDQMARLAEQPKTYDFYDLFRQQDAVKRTLLYSRLSPRAARVLGLLGTPSSQRALVTVASQNGRLLVDRQSAAAAFAIAVERRGLLLWRGEILLQYDRYNRSVTQTRETQLVLGSILDAIEAPTRISHSAASNGGRAANVGQ